MLLFICVHKLKHKSTHDSQAKNYTWPFQGFLYPLPQWENKQMHKILKWVQTGILDWFSATELVPVNKKMRNLLSYLIFLLSIHKFLVFQIFLFSKLFSLQSIKILSSISKIQITTKIHGAFRENLWMWRILN